MDLQEQIQVILQGEQQELLNVSRQENMAVGKVEEMKEIALQMRDNKNRQMGRVQVLQDLNNLPGEDEGATGEDEGATTEPGGETPEGETPEEAPEGEPTEEPSAPVERGEPKDTGDHPGMP